MWCQKKSLLPPVFAVGEIVTVRETRCNNYSMQHNFGHALLIMNQHIFLIPKFTHSIQLWLNEGIKVILHGLPWSSCIKPQTYSPSILQTHLPDIFVPLLTYLTATFLQFPHWCLPYLSWRTQGAIEGYRLWVTFCTQVSWLLPSNHLSAVDTLILFFLFSRQWHH